LHLVSYIKYTNFNPYTQFRNFRFLNTFPHIIYL